MESKTSPVDSYLVERNESHFFPNSAFKITFPNFRSTPALEVGMPVFFAIFLFTCVMPKARFKEKLRPGMGDDFLLILFLVYDTLCIRTKSLAMY